MMEIILIVSHFNKYKIVVNHETTANVIQNHLNDN